MEVRTRPQTDEIQVRMTRQEAIEVATGCKALGVFQKKLKADGIEQLYRYDQFQGNTKKVRPEEIQLTIVERKREQLFKCPICTRKGFSARGLKAHRCGAKKDRAKLTQDEIDAALPLETEADNG